MSEHAEVATHEFPPGQSQGSFFEVLGISTRLGLTSFGGPIAHLGYFHEEYVKRQKWIDEQSYADLVALCQFLPGPASSQVSIAIGIARARLLGGIAAWAAAASNLAEWWRHGAVVDWMPLWPRSVTNIADVVLILGSAQLAVWIAAS